MHTARNCAARALNLIGSANLDRKRKITFLAVAYRIHGLSSRYVGDTLQAQKDFNQLIGLGRKTELVRIQAKGFSDIP